MAEGQPPRDDGGLFQPRDDGQLHFLPGTEDQAFPVTAPENATPLEEDEPEGTIPPSPLWAMKERRHEQLLHLFGHPHRIRVRIGSGDAAVYVIDDGPRHCMIGRRVGATADGCVYSLIGPRDQGHLRVAGLGGHRRAAGLPGRLRGRAERHGRGSRGLQHLRRRLLPPPGATSPRSTCRRARSSSSPRTSRPPTADARARTRPAQPTQASTSAISSRSFAAASPRAFGSGPAANSDRDELASTDPGGHSPNRAPSPVAVRALSAHPGRQDHPAQCGQTERRRRRGWRPPPRPPSRAGGPPPG